MHLDRIEVTLARLANGNLAQKSDVSIDYHVFKHDRNKESTCQADLEAFIEQNWKERVSNNARIYNASKFRLAKFQLLPELPNPVHLQVGITSYKDLLGTHYYPRAQELILEAKLKAEKATPGFPDPFAFFSNCIGVGAIAVTSDDFVILMKRANWTGESPGQIDRPGGHPEPDLVLGLKPKDLNLSLYQDLDPDAVLDEIFSSPQNELRDEINVGLDEQLNVHLLGLIRNVKDAGGRCGLDFLINLSISKDQVKDRYNSGQQAEADESTQLIFIEKSVIKSWSIPEDLQMKLTQHATGGLRLLHLYLQANIPFSKPCSSSSNKPKTSIFLLSNATPSANHHHQRESQLAKINCEVSINHSACLTNMGAACKLFKKVTQMPISSEEDVSIILNLHNEIRSIVATGGATGLENESFPRAANMQEISWNPDLATLAQNWINQCVFEHDARENRALPPFDTVGQNLYSESMSDKPNRMPFDNAIKAWYEEASHFPVSFVSPYKPTSSALPITGHFTALIWAETNQVLTTISFISVYLAKLAMFQCRLAVA